MRKIEKKSITVTKGVAAKSHVVAGSNGRAAVNNSPRRLSASTGGNLSEARIAQIKSAIEDRIGDFQSARQLSENDFSVVINAQG